MTTRSFDDQLPAAVPALHQTPLALGARHLGECVLPADADLGEPLPEASDELIPHETLVALWLQTQILPYDLVEAQPKRPGA